MTASIPTITRELAFAAGHTAADIRMHRAGRTAWNDAERELAIRTTNKLLLYVPFEKGGLGGLPLNADQLADLGLTVADFNAAIGVAPTTELETRGRLITTVGEHRADKKLAA